MPIPGESHVQSCTATTAPPGLSIDADATRRRFLQIVGSMSLLAAGCASEERADPAPSAGPRSVTDKAGRVVQVPASPARVVVLDFGPIIAGLVEMGLTPLGATSNSKTTDFGARFGPAAAPILDVGDTNAVNLERVAALEPDLILTNTTYIDVGVEELQRIAPTVAYQGPNRYLDILRFHADVIGRRDRADALAAEFDADLMRSAARQQIAGRRVALVSVRDGSFTLFGPGLQFGLLIEALAGQVVPAAVGGKPLTEASDDLSMEVLPELLAEADLVVLLRDFAGPESDAEVAATVAAPVWQAIPAVRRGDTRTVDIQAMVGTTGFAGLRRVVEQLAERAVAPPTPAPSDVATPAPTTTPEVTP